jgi:pyruvate dehydrogenase E2 component (dihydrolipoamide acetyltransferase)
MHVVMPKLSDGMEEGTLVRWLVDDAAEVRVGTEIAEIETDKAVMTYEVEVAGTIRLQAVEGATVPVGSVIAEVLPVDGSDAAAVVGRGRPGATAAAPQRLNASPVARRVARARGVDLAMVTGSGPGGRIVKRDVEQCSVDAAPPAIPAIPTVDAGTVGSKGAVAHDELSRIQATVARRMSEAKATMPDFALTIDVDMDAVVALRDGCQPQRDGLVPTYNDFVVRSCALALRAHPRANGAFRDGRFELYERINVGIAVAAMDALLVPTIVDADRRSIGDIALEARRLAADARAGTLAPADLSSGTFTVSNLGMFGITAFTAVLNPPQAAILAVGALQERIVPRAGQPVLSRQMTLTLTCDHRILYGADAARFLSDIRVALEQPLRLAL